MSALGHLRPRLLMPRVAAAKVFLSLYFLFQDLTQYQE